MRRFSIIATVLVGGALFSLPFRRPVQIDTADEPEPATSRGLDNASIEMLVREVTQDVEAPLFFDPGASQQAIPFAAQPPADSNLPLTYEETAVPVPADPIYEKRFNATMPIAAARGNLPAHSDTALQNLARRFEEKPIAANPPFHPDFAGNMPLSMGTTRPVTSSQAEFTRPANTTVSNRSGFVENPPSSVAFDAAASQKPTSREQSVLSHLPAPSFSSDTEGEDSRERHWIRQPD
ncbi:MAG: hypothetical protein AAFV88_21730 [Planctomycetota bacterium]